jgi:hypothetical protein
MLVIRPRGHFVCRDPAAFERCAWNSAVKWLEKEGLEDLRRRQGVPGFGIAVNRLQNDHGRFLFDGTDFGGNGGVETDAFTNVSERPGSFPW